MTKIPGTFKDKEEVVEESQLPWPPPMVELFIHNGALEVQQVPTPDGMYTLVRLHTPATVYTIKLDESGVNALASALGGHAAGRILIASPNEVPGLRG